MAVDTDNPTLVLVHQLRALTVALDLAAATFAAEHRLHGTDLRALIALLDAERAGTVVGPGWLGSQLQLSSASTTALLDRLARRGLVGRTPDPADRRRVLLGVTVAARELGWSFFGPLIGAVASTLDDEFSADERAVLGRALRRLAEVVAPAPVPSEGPPTGQ